MKKRTIIQASILSFVCITLACIFIGCGAEDDSSLKEWKADKQGDFFIISYGSGSDFPQVAVIDLASSFMRMNYGYGSSWGTSIILLPSFWSRGVLYQGERVSTDWQLDGTDLIVYVNGIIGSLPVNITIRFYPPSNEQFSANVTVAANGSIALDNRPGEAFKLVTLSSMRTATDYWDSRLAFAGDSQMELPVEGWFFKPSAFTSLFGLTGGSSSWKEKSPTIEISLDQPVDVTGWVTYSEDPNDDNVGMWGASNDFVGNYSYKLTAKP